MTAPTEASLLCFLLGCEEGTFSWWWITSLSHEVKVKHTRSGGVLPWMSMDHLKWNQFSWRIRAGCHNGFYLTPINTCIDLLVESNLVRGKECYTHKYQSNAETNVARCTVTSVNPSWFFFILLRSSRCRETQPRGCECLIIPEPCNFKTWISIMFL